MSHNGKGRSTHSTRGKTSSLYRKEIEGFPRISRRLQSKEAHGMRLNCTSHSNPGAASGKIIVTYGEGLVNVPGL